MLGNNTKLLFIELIIKIVEHYILGCYASPRSENVVVQSLSPFWLFATPWTAASQNSLSFTISRSLLKLMSIEPVIPSNHLILCHPLLLSPSVFPSIGGLFQWVSSSHQVAKVLELQFSISPSNDIQGWFPLGLTGLISLQPKGLSRVSPTPQFKGINSSVLSLLHPLTSIHDYWRGRKKKTYIILTIRTFVNKVISLFF